MKKFYLILIALIALLGFLLSKQIKETFNITTKRETSPIVSTNSVFIPSYKTDPIFGNPGAPITIVEFSDFNCKECSQVHAIIKEKVKKYPEKLRLIWKSAPLGGFFSLPDTMPHKAAFCAGKQNQFWNFTDIAIEAKKKLDEKSIQTIISALDLEPSIWQKCFNSQAAEEEMASSTIFAAQFGINKAPVIFINNRWINLDTGADLGEVIEKFVEADQEL